MNIYCDMDHVLMDASEALKRSYAIALEKSGLDLSTSLSVANNIVCSNMSWDRVRRSYGIDDSIHEEKNKVFGTIFDVCPPTINTSLVSILNDGTMPIIITTSASIEATKIKIDYMQSIGEYVRHTHILAGVRKDLAFWRSLSKGIVIDDSDVVLSQAAEARHRALSIKFFL